MQTWTDTTYKLGEKDHLTVCEHGDSVSLSLPGYMHDMEHGSGFSLYLKPAHLTELRKAVANLEDILASQQYDFVNGEVIARSLAAMGEDDEYNGDPTCTADGYGAVTDDPDSAYTKKMEEDVAETKWRRSKLKMK